MICDPKISVVIPVYNGGKYLEDTLKSVLAQSFQCYEVICVDDGSSDNSVEILRRAALIDSRVRFFCTPENLGIVPRVMNFAAKYIRGKYFVYSSQDDLFSNDWLESMYLRAEETGADATIPDVVFYHGELNGKYSKLSGLHGDKSVILSGRDAFVYSLDWSIPGNSMWKSSLIKEYGYFEFGLNADEYTARFYYLNSSKVVFSGGEFYYRKDNPEAVTVKVSSRSFDLPYTEFKLWQLARDSGFDSDVQFSTLKRSVRSLLYYYPFTFKKQFRERRNDVLAMCDLYQSEDVCGWFFNYDGRKGFVELVATHSKFMFVIVSILMWLVRRLIGIFR